MKKLLAFVLTLAMVLSMSACGGRGQTAPTEETPETVGERQYAAEFLSLPEGMATLTDMSVNGERLLVGGFGEGAMLGYIEPDSGRSGMLCDLSDYEYLFSFCETQEGFTALCGDLPQNYYLGGSPTLRTNEDFSGKMYLVSISADGEVLSEAPVADKFIDEHGQMSLFRQMSRQGDKYVILASGVLAVLSSDGEKLGEIAVGDEDRYFNSMLEYDGGLLVCRGAHEMMRRETGTELCTFDAETLTLTTPEELPDNYIAGIGTDEDGNLLLNDETGDSGGVVYKYAFTGEPGDMIIDFEALGYPRESFRKLWLRRDGRLYCLGAAQDAVFYAEEKPLSEAKTELTLATDQKMPGLTNLVTRFNKENKDYVITVNQYKDLDALRVEIGAGKAPDIFAFYHSEMDAVSDVGVYEDLFPYLDADADLSREMPVQGLINAMVEDGKLYWMPYDFSIFTFTAPESVVGKRGRITMEEAESFAAQMGAEVSVFPAWMSKSILLGWTCSFAISAFVDRENGTCDFENPDFIALLNKCALQADDVPEGSGVPNEGESLLSQEPLQNLFGVAKREEMRGKIAYTGFPNDATNGSIFSVNLKLAMSSQSENKDGVWEFIRGALKYESMAAGDFVPALQTVLDRDIDLAVKGEYSDPNMGKVTLSQEQADKLRTLIDETQLLQSRDSTIQSIIEEEAQVFFAGDCTAEECARRIQSRAALYLGERN